MNCKIYRREIEHIESRQTLSADTSAHIESCTACFEFKREHDSLQNLIGNLERVNAPTNFDAGLRARLAQSKQHHPNGFTWLNFSLLRPAMGVGFTLVLMVVGLVFIRPLLTDENKSLNSVAEMSSINNDEMSADKITKFEVITTINSVDTEEKDKRYTPRRSGLAKVNNREEILVDDKGVGGAVAGIVVPVSSDSRSHYVILNDKKVPLRSVSFGLPTFVEGKTVKTNYASDSQGVW